MDPNSLTCDGFYIDSACRQRREDCFASWGRLEKLNSFDETKIVDFINANKNKSPEPLAR